MLVRAMIAPPGWSLNGTTARLQSGVLTGEITVGQPHLGVHDLSINQDSIPGALLSASRDAETGAVAGWPLPVADLYVRGDDLIASYAPAADWPYALQIYWQANALPSIEDAQSSLSLLVSVQTELLDTHPRIHVTTQIAGDEMLHLSIGERGDATLEPISRSVQVRSNGSICCVILRLAGVPFSYVEFVAAADFHQAQLTFNERASAVIEWRLFAEFLEKGVIRRARIHSAILPRVNDIELAIDCARALELRPLPLTV